MQNLLKIERDNLINKIFIYKSGRGCAILLIATISSFFECCLYYLIKLSHTPFIY